MGDQGPSPMFPGWRNAPGCLSATGIDRLFGTAFAVSPDSRESATPRPVIASPPVSLPRHLTHRNPLRMITQRLHRCLFATAVLASVASGGGVRGEVINIVQTGIQGSQTSLDTLRSYAWNFTVPTPRTYDSITAKFQLKRGPSTTAPAVMTLWSTGSSFDIATGTSIGSFSLLSGSATQSFVQYDFSVDTTATQLYGYYALALTSSASTQSSQAWFIKGNTSSLQFLDGNGQVIPDITDNGEVVPVPEPSSMLLSGLVATAFAVMVRRHRSSRKVDRRADILGAGIRSMPRN